MVPNVPTHPERRAGDYPCRKAPPYGWRDDNGVPVWHLDSNGTPVCGRKRNNEDHLCESAVVGSNGRCNAMGHNGDPPLGEDHGNTKHGRSSIETRRREDWLKQLRAYTKPGSKKTLEDLMFASLWTAMQKNDASTARWMFDQHAGTAKTTVKYEVASDSTFSAFVDAMVDIGLDQDLIDQIVDGATRLLTNDSSGSGQEGEGSSEA